MNWEAIAAVEKVIGAARISKTQCDYIAHACDDLRLGVNV
jgi:hypothetical protein